MKVITISGHAGSGKDTVALLIQNKLSAFDKKVLITHYADLLKYICKTFFGWNGKKDEDGRFLLQYVGTDVIRKANPDFWVDYLSFILKCFKHQWDYVVIPDARFPNEIEKLKSDGFDVVHLRIEREEYDSLLTADQQNHESETALDNIKAEFYIQNNGDLSDLSEAVGEWIKENVL